MQTKDMAPVFVLMGMASFIMSGTPISRAAAEPAAPAPQGAEQLQGAEAVLERLSRPDPTPTPTPAPKVAAASNPFAAYRQRLEAFQRQAATLPPVDAARGWLALANSYSKARKTPHQPAAGEKPLQFSEVVAVLPPPTAWAALAQAIESSRPVAAKRSPADRSLLLLAHTLTDNEAAQWRDVTELAAASKATSPGQRRNLNMVMLQLAEALTNTSSDPQRIVQGVVLRLSLREAMGQEGQGGSFTIPDLVTLAGPQRAAAILRRALMLRGAALEIPVGKESQKLARKLAVELIDKIPTAQWSLAHSLDATQLYEALNRRFAATKTRRYSSDDWSRRGAQKHYWLGLIKAGRKADALRFTLRWGASIQGNYFYMGEMQDSLTALDQAGRTPDVLYVLSSALAQNPALPFWDLYITTATRAGQNEQMLSLARTAAARPKLPAAVRRQLQGSLYRALLAADRVPEGVALLRQLLGSTAGAPKNGQPQYDRASYAVALARLGRLLKRPEWVEEGVRAALAALAHNPDSQATEVADLLIELGRWAEAEKVLTEALATAAQRGKAQRNQSYYSSYSGMEPPERPYLKALANLYERAGRHADVLKLLRDAPYWSARDLAEIYLKPDYSEPPLGYIAASALAATGDKAAALPILRAVIQARGGYDPAYELLVKLEGRDALPFLESLYQRDRFEERPLIWKAHILWNAGQLEDAEKAARAAIAIDPSDGEQPKGDRMRVYAVLAGIRQARGQLAEATELRAAVKAIRLSEQADEFYAAGLLQRGIALYKESLRHFADAYCIQSRLAVQLAELGQDDAALAHYQRAYELMPASFGRMESHCFGCERVFNGKRAETIAEKVFKQMAAKTPGKPQVHYLLGYLREEQGRYHDALVSFRRAVQLDPDYINAWQHVFTLGERLGLPRAERDAATFNLLRLDPQMRHASPNLTKADNLKSLWKAVEDAARHQAPPVPQALLPLSGSQIELEKQEAERKKRMGEQGMSHFSSGEEDDYDPDARMRRSLTSPGRALSAHQLMAAIAQLMDVA